MSRIINEKLGIWENKLMFPELKNENKLTLGEGNTPVYKVQFGDSTVLFKDETQNPTQSFKDRGIAYQLTHYFQEGYRNFVISSSGNAARSVIAYAALIPESSVTVFVGEDIPEYKLDNIYKTISENQKVKVIKSKTAKSDAIKYARETNAINLRGSVDEYAVPGFKTLGAEITQIDKPVDAIFICCSSGTSTSGMFEGLDKNSLPQIHVVQTTKINNIAKKFDSDFDQTDSSIINAVSDRVAHRKQFVWDIIDKTKGSGWVVSDEEVIEAKSLLTQKGIDIEGYNAYVSFAGYLKAICNGKEFENPICILTGL